MIVSATRVRGKVSKTELQDWQLPASVTLGDFAVEGWAAYPGLFAGGVMDIMTAALLERLPRFSSKSILDFCSGSGTIGGILQSRYPSAKVTLLDADAIAIHAAGRNMELLNAGKPRCILSNCFDGLKSKKNFDWIVSNPPVHRNKANDFSVCKALATGAARHLKADGTLFVVCQAYVPMRSMLTTFNSVTVLSGSDGRFNVWVARDPLNKKKRKRE